MITDIDDKITDDKDFKVGDKKTISRYFVEDRRESGSLILLRVSSLPDSDVMVEERRVKKNEKTVRRTQTFSHY